MRTRTRSLARAHGKRPGQTGAGIGLAVVNQELAIDQDVADIAALSGVDDGGERAVDRQHVRSIQLDDRDVRRVFIVGLPISAATDPAPGAAERWRANACAAGSTAGATAFCNNDARRSSIKTHRADLCRLHRRRSRSLTPAASSSTTGAS